MSDKYDEYDNYDNYDVIIKSRRCLHYSLSFRESLQTMPRKFISHVNL